MQLTLIHPVGTPAPAALPGQFAILPESSFGHQFAVSFASDLVDPGKFASQTDPGGDVRRRLLGMRALGRTDETAHAYLEAALERWKSGDAKSAATAAFESAAIFSQLQNRSMAASVRRLLAVARVFHGNLEGAADALSSACQDHFFQADFAGVAQVMGGMLNICNQMQHKDYSGSSISTVTAVIAVYSGLLSQDFEIPQDKHRLARYAADAWRLHARACAKSSINVQLVIHAYEMSARLYVKAGLKEKSEYAHSALKAYLLENGRVDLADDIRIEPRREQEYDFDLNCLMNETMSLSLERDFISRRRAGAFAQNVNHAEDGGLLDLKVAVSRL